MLLYSFSVPHFISNFILVAMNDLTSGQDLMKRKERRSSNVRRRAIHVSKCFRQSFQDYE